MAYGAFYNADATPTPAGGVTACPEDPRGNIKLSGIFRMIAPAI